MGLIFDSDDTSFQECGGTLVGERYVITAAHCTSKTSNIRVIIGDTTLGVANDTTRFIMRVSEIRVHPTSVGRRFYNFAFKQKYLVFVWSEIDDI